MAQDLKPLTTLRFFAAAWVVLYDYWPALSPDVPALISKGYLGVELFFVLSGFILSHVYLDAFGDGRGKYWAFLWARLARIYPLHLAILAGLIALIGISELVGIHGNGRLAVWSSLPGQLALLQAWGATPLGGWNHPAWSISAEWFAYLTFPATAWILWRVRQRPVVAVLLSAVFLVVMNVGFKALTGEDLTHQTIQRGIVRIIPCFVFGGAINLLWRRITVTRLVAWALIAESLIAMVGLALRSAPDFAFGLAFGCLIFGLGQLSKLESRAFTGGLGVYLGEVSYAIYMVCIPWKLAFEPLLLRIIHPTGGHLTFPAWFVLTLGVLIPAIIAHHVVEAPARRWMRAIVR